MAIGCKAFEGKCFVRVLYNNALITEIFYNQLCMWP